MAKKVGKNASIKLGTDTVVGMGTWSMDGTQTDEIDSSAFGDEWKSFEFGMKSGGTVSFSGHFDPSDQTGAQKLIEANAFNSALTTLRFYLDNTSYYVPCQTTGYLSPYLTTGAPTVLSSVVIINPQISTDMSGLAKISFQAKMKTGCMVLV